MILFGKRFRLKSEGFPKGFNLLSVFRKWRPVEIYQQENTISFFTRHSLYSARYQVEIRENTKNLEIRFYPEFQIQIALIIICVFIFLSGVSRSSIFAALILGFAFVVFDVFYISISIHKTIKQNLEEYLEQESDIENERAIFKDPGQCPACGFEISEYHSRCPGCGLHFTDHKKVTSNVNSTSSVAINYVYKSRKP